MKPSDVIRVVALRKGKLKAAEFRLRPGERGLSLFALVDSPSFEEIVEAVRLAGKQGDLAAAVFAARDLRELGLRLKFTNGGTSNSAVNAIHLEARLPWWREWLLSLRGLTVVDYFNERYSDHLCTMAQIEESGGPP
jgi:hypothetical protein